MVCIFISTVARIFNIFVKRVVSPFLEGWRLIRGMFGVHIGNLVKRLEPSFMGIGMHCSISSVENLSFSLKVKRNWAMNIRGNYVILRILTILIIGFLSTCSSSCGSVVESSVKGRSIQFTVCALITSIVLIIVVWCHWLRINNSFCAIKCSNSTFLFREPSLVRFKSWSHYKPLVPFMTNRWAKRSCVSSSWRTWRTFRDGRCLLNLFFSLLLNYFWCFFNHLWDHI